MLSIVLPSALPLLTVALWVYVHRRFYRVSAYLPLALAGTMRTYDTGERSAKHMCTAHLFPTSHLV